MHVILDGKFNTWPDRCVRLIKPWTDVGISPHTGRPAIPLPGQGASPFWFNADGTCKTYAIIFSDGQAHVPNNIGEIMVRRLGYRRGSDRDPDNLDRCCREATAADIEAAAAAA